MSSKMRRKWLTAQLCVYRQEQSERFNQRWQCPVVTISANMEIEPCLRTPSLNLLTRWRQFGGALVIEKKFLLRRIEIPHQMF